MRVSATWPIAVLPLLTIGPTAYEEAVTSTVEGTIYTPNVRMAGAVVYIVPDRNQTSLPPIDHPIIDQVNLRFVPRVTVVVPGTTVEFRNSDPILHNVFHPENPGEGFNLGTYLRTDRRAYTFDELGAHVILCHVHPEMVAYVVVIPTPFYSIVDAAGHFRIDRVPPGRHTLLVWHRSTESFERPIVVREGNVLHLELELSRRER